MKLLSAIMLHNEFIVVIIYPPVWTVHLEVSYDPCMVEVFSYKCQRAITSHILQQQYLFTDGT